MMPRIGPGEELHLPHELYILADKGYPEQYPLLTPWRDSDSWQATATALQFGASSS